MAVIGVSSAVLLTPATAADEGETGSCNPMGAATPTDSENGYTLFVTGDAILANSELEGTLAVGGTATFGDERGYPPLQYPIMHNTGAGNADYDVPTIEGTPNRVLIQRFASDGKVVQVKSQGATGANAEAGVRIADQRVPDGYTFGPMFGGSGTTFFPSGGGNMSPQLESQVQAWNAADPGAGWSVDGAVLDQFPADQGRTLLGTTEGWHAVAAPAGNDQTITLNTEDPSRLPLSAFAGISKFKLEGYSQDSFLVITVAPSDVVDGRLVLPSYSHAGKDPEHKEGISHILFDLSDITGDVEITTADAPVRGAIYAPQASITFPADGKEFEGQLIAKNLTALQHGKEIHTNLFKGRFSGCAPKSTATATPTKSTATATPTKSTAEATATSTGSSSAGVPTQSTAKATATSTGSSSAGVPTQSTAKATATSTGSSSAGVPTQEPSDGADAGRAEGTPSSRPSPGLPSAGAGTAIPVFGAIAALAAIAGALVIRRRHAR
ncbi:collagen-binding domain-containing protein [Tessaracoccus lacteus]|uniref:Choice-of-anchor A family protein n=1 Tax=Tessaracoccus lacteus TaxID=3041766 RepID=A0ABY8PXA7_9ACTN|nr:collagen-binding domain-containing protein [Tessaracoccus sp. T21]WGT47104.1 choice-of-anchor A family protein [Tessaracoccus sp. T21]